MGWKLAPTQSEVPYESFAASIQQDALFWHALFKATVWKTKQHNAGTRFLGQNQENKIEVSFLSVCISLFGWELYYYIYYNTIHGTQKSST